MTPDEQATLAGFYRDRLFNDTLPFWFPRCIDDRHGGYLTCVDRNGAVVDTDKSVWAQGRMAWLLATLYATVEPREEWLRWSRAGIRFLREHCLDADGQMFFQVTCDGQPLRKRRYVFSEAFMAMALAAYARAACDDAAAGEAKQAFAAFRRFTETPGLLPAKVDPVTRPSKSLASPMITLGIAQTLREALGEDAETTPLIDRCIEEIRTSFVDDARECVWEMVGADGEALDHFEGRLLNPGHAIEAAWFILNESRYRGGDAELTAMGTRMLEWMWARGWDTTHGGLLSFVDVRGLPVQEYWHDMKFWWPHNEAIIATLLAWKLTGNTHYLGMHDRVHRWAHEHFADPERGEWFGYLHRDGSVASELKGGLWKSAFHLPRMQLFCWQLLANASSSKPSPPWITE
jgi:N-acylglucosamine 2-epimerase